MSVAGTDTAQLTIAFSGPVTIDTGVTPDAGFHDQEQSPTDVSLSDATHVVANFPSPVGSGDPWSLDFQPNWLNTAVTNPASGTVT